MCGVFRACVGGVGRGGAWVGRVLTGSMSTLERGVCCLGWMKVWGKGRISVGEPEEHGGGGSDAED